MPRDFDDFDDLDHERNQPERRMNDGTVAIVPVRSWAGMPLAGIAHRSGSYIIDAGLALALPFLPAYALSAVIGDNWIAAYVVGFLIVYFANVVALQGATGQSLGRRATQTVLVQAMRDMRSGEQVARVPSFAVLLGRAAWIAFVEQQFWYVSLVLIGVGRKRQTGADLIFGTVVIPSAFRDDVWHPRKNRSLAGKPMRLKKNAQVFLTRDSE